MHELCGKCFRKILAHPLEGCPGPAIHVDMTSESVMRARQTGHPRLLAKVILGQQRGALMEVEISSLVVDGVEVKA